MTNSQRNSISSDQSSASNILEFTEFSRAECWKYFVFLVIFTTMMVLGRGLGSKNYYVSEQVSKQFTQQYFLPQFTEGEKTLMDIDQYFEIFDWLKEVSIPILLMNANSNLVAGQNKVLGAIRIRQLRVKEEECAHIDPNWSCYPRWQSSNEAIHDTPSGIKWRSVNELNEKINWWGVREKYSGSGYVRDLPLNHSTAIAQINDLQTTNFIDRATRFIVQDAALYNPTLNLHCMVRISFELAACGGVVPSFEIKTWRFHRYEQERGRVLMVFEILFVLFVVYFTFEEIYEFKTKSWQKYSSDKWNMIDVLNLILYYITIGWRISEMIKMRDIELVPTDTDKYTNYRDLAKRFEYEAYIQTLNAFLLYIKVFKYMTFSKRVKFLFTMLHRSSNDLFIFSIVLMVVFFAFGMMGFLAFSSDVNDFRSFPHSVINLVRYTVVEPPYEELTNSNKVLGAFYFVIWGVVMLLILSNVFIAILCDAYAEITCEMTDDDDTDILSKIFSATIVNKFIQKIKDFGAMDVNKDGALSAKEIANAMSISTDAARDIVNKYDTNDDGKLNEKEYQNFKFYNKANNKIAPLIIEKTNASLNKVVKPDDIELEQRLHKIENTIHCLLVQSEHANNDVAEEPMTLCHI